MSLPPIDILNITKYVYAPTCVWCCIRGGGVNKIPNQKIIILPQQNCDICHRNPKLFVVLPQQVLKGLFLSLFSINLPYRANWFCKSHFREKKVSGTHFANQAILVISHSFLIRLCSNLVRMLTKTTLTSRNTKNQTKPNQTNPNQTEPFFL